MEKSEVKKLATAREGWIYVGVRLTQADDIDRLIKVGEKRRIYRSRQDIVAEALADYFEKPEIAKFLQP